MCHDAAELLALTSHRWNSFLAASFTLFLVLLLLAFISSPSSAKRQANLCWLSLRINCLFGTKPRTQQSCTKGSKVVCSRSLAVCTRRAVLVKRLLAGWSNGDNLLCVPFFWFLTPWQSKRRRTASKGVQVFQVHEACLKRMNHLMSTTLS